VIFDSEKPLIHPTELERSEVYVPEAITDFLEPHVLACERVGHADPATIPTKTTVATDEADFKVAGVFQWCELPWQGAR
jgi:hypothetical protein